MIIKKIINKILIYRKRLKISKLASLSKGGYDDNFVNRGTTIHLIDGSTPADIVIGKRVWLWGRLNSQNGGQITIGDYTLVGEHDSFNAVERITIGKYVMFAPNVSIDDNNNHPVSPAFRKYMRIMGDDDSRLWKYADSAPVVIGDNCWIGRNVSIMKGVTIGNNCVIAAHSVVTKSVPANCMAAGNPAKVVKTNIDSIPAPTNCIGFNEYIKFNKNSLD